MSGEGGAFRGCPTHGTQHTACRGHDSRLLADRVKGKRRRELYRQGLKVRVSTGPAVEHLNQLLAGGATQIDICRVYGCARSMLRAVLTGAQTMIHRDTEALILSMRLEDVLAVTHVIPSVGTSRRLQGLVAMGYGPIRLARECGISRFTMTRLLHGRELSIQQATARRIEASARRLVLTQGGSSAALRQAQHYGWVPLAAWDDIDDPAERPKLGVRAVGERRRAVVEDTAELLSRGLSKAEISERLGIEWGSIVVAHARAGIRLEVAS